MTTRILIPDSNSRPFGILGNDVLPFKDSDGRSYPSVEHYALASLLPESERPVVLSYPAIPDAKRVFNRLDEKYYLSVIREACNVFQEKKCRSTQIYNGNQTVGSICRLLLKSNNAFKYICHEENNLAKVLGIIQQDDGVFIGHDMVVQSILRTKRLLHNVNIPEGLEYIFWKIHPSDVQPIKDKKEYRMIIENKKKNPLLRKQKQIRYEETIFEGDDEQVYDDDIDDDKRLPTELAFNPNAMPMYRDKNKLNWIPTHIGSRIDELRIFSGDILYTKEASPIDIFKRPDTLHIDALTIFKIYKVAEHLVELMHNGVDVHYFNGKPIDSILWECKICPELFGMGVSLSVQQRNMIYVETLDKFRSKTLPYYEFVEKEIIYPGNIAGFVRKNYIDRLNFYIGEKIVDLLFSEFLEQTLQRSYPTVPEAFHTLVLTRERASFTPAEYEEITSHLYHLFFANKFQVKEERAKRIRFYETQRVSEQDILNAMNFIPHVFPAHDAIDINNTVLDPFTQVDVTIHGKKFNNLIQYIYYNLYKVYGNMSDEEAYNYLWHNEIMIGDQQLQQRLNTVIEIRHDHLIDYAVSKKIETYSQVLELLLYLKSTMTDFELEQDPDAERALKKAVLDEQLLKVMKFVVSIIPTDQLHIERSVFLFSFLREFFRSFNIYRCILDNPNSISHQTILSFIKCFYPHLQVLVDDNDIIVAPQNFAELMVNKKECVGDLEKTKKIHLKTPSDDVINIIWTYIHPLIKQYSSSSIIPSQLFMESKQRSSIILLKDSMKALARVIQCLYPNHKTQEIPNHVFHSIVKIISGKDDILLWKDPSFTLLMYPDTSEEILGKDILPKEIRDKLPKRKKVHRENRLVHYNIIHAEAQHILSLMKDILHEDLGPNLSRLSYAGVALHKNRLHPRRISFYT